MKRPPSTLAVVLACAMLGAAGCAQQTRTAPASGERAMTAPSATTAARSGTSTPAPAQEMAYDYQRMDKNRDNLISPEEMQAELDRGKASPASASGTTSSGTKK
jgi:hypothetical protein